jgi:hypothetical protein
MWRIPVSTYLRNLCLTQDLTHQQDVNLIRGHQCPPVVPPNMGATPRSVTLEEQDLKQLYLEAMPPGWRQRYPSQTCQAFRSMTERRTAIPTMGLNISPSDYLGRPKQVPYTCVHYIDDMKYRTMSYKQRYQLLPSVSKNTRRKKPQPKVSWTTTGDFSTENRRTKTNMTEMWLCFYSTVLAYLPIDHGPVPDHNPTGAPIITHVMIKV